MPHPLRIHVDHAACVGNAMCVATAPGVFAHDDNRQSTVIDPAGADRETILAAAANCPVSAISVEEEATGEPLFPTSSDAG